VIQLAITLVTTAGVSFRAVSKIIIQLNLYLHLNLEIPTHTTVLNWTKKQGISKFREGIFFDDQKWVLIADESIQFGNKKLLLVLAVPESRCEEGKELSYKDLMPLVLKVSSSWKSEDIAFEIQQHIALDQISYCISDTGSNLVNAFKSLNCIHIPDINHKFSLIIKSVFGSNCILDDYTKNLSSLRTKKSMSKIARIVPPNQRIMNRFMNLTPLFEWGVTMINLLDKNELTEDEKMEISFLESASLKEFIYDSYQILIGLNYVQQILKSKGYNEISKREALALFSNIESENALKIKSQLELYFGDLSTKAQGKTICCSSDIIESCFGKFKEIVKGNKAVGISDLSLCIAAITGINNSEKTREAMETVSIRR
jgi:hypothetical protein